MKWIKKTFSSISYTNVVGELIQMEVRKTADLRSLDYKLWINSKYVSEHSSLKEAKEAGIKIAKLLIIQAYQEIINE